MLLSNISPLPIIFPKTSIFPTNIPSFFYNDEQEHEHEIPKSDSKPSDRKNEINKRQISGSDLQ